MWQSNNDVISQMTETFQNELSLNLTLYEAQKIVEPVRHPPTYQMADNHLENLTFL